jgi:hypothetical protein
MDFWILTTLFVTPTKLMNMDSYQVQMYYSHVLIFLKYCMIDVKKIKDVNNECNMISIYCVMDFSRFQKL